MYIPSLWHIPLLGNKSEALPILKEEGGLYKYIIPGGEDHGVTLKSLCHLKFLFYHFTLHYPLYLCYFSPRPLTQRLKTPNMICGPFFLVVGLKLNSVDPTMSIDLKYLGVQLPLAPATSFPFWNLTGTNPASPGEYIAFMKSNKFVNINEKLPLLETKYV